MVRHVRAAQVEAAHRRVVVVGNLAHSRRSLTRRFRADAGLSFAEWRRRACLLSALPWLAWRERVTGVALDLGYSNLTAFGMLCRRVPGVASSAHGRRLIAREADAQKVGR